MERKMPQVRGRAWLGVVGVLVALFTLTIASAAVYDLAVKDNASHAVPWYAETNPAPSSPMAAGHPSSDQATSEHAANYAKSLSKAFRDASGRVLPSVVMVINTPAVAKQSVERKRSPNDDSEDMPFGFQGAPFGDLFKSNPELRRFFKEMPGLPSPGMPGAAWWAPDRE